MYKKFNGFFRFTLCLAAFWTAGIALFAQPASLEEAHRLYDQQDFTRAQEAYEALYAQGIFSEKMLYRLAYIHEQLHDYPSTIYYLKKIQQEYGGEEIEPKIRQLIQTLGSDRYFSEDTWNSWIRFMRQWAWAVYSGLGLALVLLAVITFVPRKKLRRGRMMIGGAGYTLLAASLLLLFIHTFLVPERAVITEPTSFYMEPSYAAKNFPRSLSVGETVRIAGEEDIWVKVTAGRDYYWIPKRVLRRL